MKNERMRPMHRRAPEKLRAIRRAAEVVNGRGEDEVRPRKRCFSVGYAGTDLRRPADCVKHRRDDTINEQRGILGASLQDYGGPS